MVMSKVKYSRARRMLYARAVLRLQDGQAVKIQRLLSKELRQSAKEIAAEYAATGKMVKSKKAHQKRLEAIFEKTLPALVRIFMQVPFKGAEKRITVQRIDSDTSDLELEVETIAYILQGARTRAAGIAATTLQRAKAVIARGLVANLTTAVISKNIGKMLGGLTSASRAATIARTTVHTAANSAQDASARSTGLTYKREWIATNDDRVREVHQEADGQMVDGEEDFNVGGESLAYPGDPNGSPENICNCRCVVGFVFPED